MSKSITLINKWLININNWFFQQKIARTFLLQDIEDDGYEILFDLF